MNSLYVEALAAMTEPATAKAIHAKAVEMFGAKVKGDTASVRSSMARAMLLGKVERTGRGLFYATAAAVDPISALLTENRVLTVEIERLRAELAAAQK